MANHLSQLYHDQLAKLSLSRAYLASVKTGAVVLLLCLTGIEAAARTPPIQTLMLFRPTGSNHLQLDIQWNNFLAWHEENGPADCIFLGKSMVFRDINPTIVEEEFLSVTGKKIKCYNFGVAGAGMRDLKVIAEVLLKDYHPEVLIVGSFFGDFTESPASRESIGLEENPLMRMHLGDFSAHGWLQKNSYAFGLLELTNYNLGWGWLWREPPEKVARWENEIQDNGYGYSEEVLQDVSKLGRPSDINARLERLGNQDSINMRLDVFAAIVDLGNVYGTEVVLLSMPFHPSLAEYLGDDPEARRQQEIIDGHRIYIETSIEEIAKTKGAILLSKRFSEFREIQSWRDTVHLLPESARIFSTWVGQQLGLLAANQELSIFSTP